MEEEGRKTKSLAKVLVCRDCQLEACSETISEGAFFASVFIGPEIYRAFALLHDATISRFNILTERNENNDKALRLEHSRCYLCNK